MQPYIFENSIIKWYKNNSRSLPWRDTKSPYFIWLSEIILQQTKVDQGLPYYQRFTERFPNIESLASASEQEVLRLWQGLGYYSRARNLHKCAHLIVSKYESRFPNTYEELLKLPGVGKYTAAAIASFAFQQRVPTIDGNAYRVLSRVYGIEQDIAASKAHALFFDFAKELMSENNASAFNQALMEYGALQCKPKSPNCQDCSLSSSCYAYLHNKQSVLPIKIKKLSVKKRYFNYFIFKKGDKISFKKRTEDGIWKNLYDFHLIETDFSEENIEKTIFELEKTIGSKLKIVKISKSYKHVLSHQQLFAHFILIEIEHLPEEFFKENSLDFYSLKEVENLPKPKLIENYLEDEFV